MFARVQDIEYCDASLLPGSFCFVTMSQIGGLVDLFSPLYCFTSFAFTDLRLTI